MAASMLEQHTTDLGNALARSGVPLRVFLHEVLRLIESSDRISAQGMSKAGGGYLKTQLGDEVDAPGALAMVRYDLPGLRAVLRQAALWGIQHVASSPAFKALGEGYEVAIEDMYAAFYSPLSRGGMDFHGDALQQRRCLKRAQASVRLIVSFDFSENATIPGTCYRLLGHDMIYETRVQQGTVMACSPGSQVKGCSIAQHAGRAKGPDGPGVARGAEGEPPHKVSFILDVVPKEVGSLSERNGLYKAALQLGSKSAPAPPPQHIWVVPPPGGKGRVWDAVVSQPAKFKHLHFQNIRNGDIVKPSSFHKRSSDNGE